jgi:hypothetical protein
MWAVYRFMICVFALMGASCSGELRQKPALSCSPQQTSQGIACLDGVIGHCENGSLQYTACSDSDVCDANWQDRSNYRCSVDGQDDPSDLPSVGSAATPTLEEMGITVVADDNMDGLLSPGESARLSVKIRNAWTHVAENVSGVISTDQAGVTITEGSKLYFGSIVSGQTACGATSSTYAGYCDSGSSVLLSIRVDSSVPAGTQVGFKLTVSDQNANQFDLAFSLTLKAIAQTFSVGTVQAAADTNGDGVVSPGETARLEVPLVNNGTSTALGIVGAVSTTQAGVTITDGNKLYFGSIVSGQTACGATSSTYAGYCDSGSSVLLSIRVDSSVPVGTRVDFQLKVSDQFNNMLQLTWSVTIGRN